MKENNMKVINVPIIIMVKVGRVNDDEDNSHYSGANHNDNDDSDRGNNDVNEDYHYDNDNGEDLDGDSAYNDDIDHEKRRWKWYYVDNFLDFSNNGDYKRSSS